VFFQNFIRLKDKETVRSYLKQYISSCAYFGYTDNLNMELVT